MINLFYYARFLTWGTAFLAIFFIVFNVAPLLPYVGTYNSWLSHNDRDSHGRPLFDSVGSDPAILKVNFQHLRDLQDLGPKGDEIWNSHVLPPNGGMIWAKTNNSHQEDGAVDMEGWGITMFHAIHCLQMIREIFKTAALHEQKDAFAGRRREDHSDHGDSHHHGGSDTKHATHCLSYLYQVCILLLCPI